MTTMQRRYLVLALDIGACITIFGACMIDSGGPGLRIEDFAAAYADAFCSNIADCCQQEGFAYNAETCRAKAQFILGGEASAAQRDGTPYDPAAARACVDTVASLARSCSGDQVEEKFRATCGHVYSGSQAEGAACDTGFQCASGDCLKTINGPWHCVGPSGPVHGKVGQSCNATCSRNAEAGTVSCYPDFVGPSAGVVQCFVDDEEFCDTQTQICTAKADIGEACGPTVGCRSGAFCENGVCAAKRTDGPCTDSDACAPTAYCGYATPRQCLLRKARGETCGSDEQCAVGDDCNQTCRGVTLANKNSCM